MIEKTIFIKIIFYISLLLNNFSISHAHFRELFSSFVASEKSEIEDDYIYIIIRQGVGG